MERERGNVLLCEGKGQIINIKFITCYWWQKKLWVM